MSGPKRGIIALASSRLSFQNKAVSVSCVTPQNQLALTSVVSPLNGLVRNKRLMSFSSLVIRFEGTCINAAFAQ